MFAVKRSGGGVAEKWSKTGGLNGPAAVLIGGGGLRPKERCSKLGVRPVVSWLDNCCTETLRDCITETRSTGLVPNPGEATRALLFAVTDDGIGLWM